MNPRKKDLEIICNLQWKNKPNNGGSNIIGVYDIPSTTLKWEVFKSYILKNSGTTGNDVKVSYLATKDKEFPIDTQLDFQIALYAFRKKARNGEIINIKLDRISDRNMPKQSLLDVQTQSVNDDSASSVGSLGADEPPEWFLKYMTKFKKEIIDEIAVISNVSSESSVNSQAPHISKKCKPSESTTTARRSRKHSLHLAEGAIEKDLKKSLKLERKLESKLEKLEAKCKKRKNNVSKVLHPIDLIPDTNTYNSPIDEVKLMNASPIFNGDIVIPHLVGGDVYLHTFNVINVGSLAWTTETKLRFTWGSALLEPIEREVQCPLLRPDERGCIRILLKVPVECGLYECYWHFFHKNIKFGRWLACQIIVDQRNMEPWNKSFLDSYEYLKEHSNSTAALKPNNSSAFSKNKTSKDEELTSASVATMQKVKEMMEKLAISTDGENCTSDSDNQSVVSESEVVEKPDEKEDYEAVDKNVSKHVDDFCVVSMPEEKEEKVPIIDNVVIKGNSSKIQLIDEEPNEDMQNSKTESQQLIKNEIAEESQHKKSEEIVENDNNNNAAGDGNDDSSSESIGKLDYDGDNADTNSTSSDLVYVNFAEESEGDDNIGYAYVIVDGQKVPIPKKYLRSDYLEIAEEAPNPHAIKPNQAEGESKTPTINAQEVKISLEKRIEENIINAKKEEVSDLGSAQNNAETLNKSGNQDEALEFENHIGSNEGNHSTNMKPSFENNEVEDANIAQTPRLFIFPENRPGYEVTALPVSTAPPKSAGHQAPQREIKCEIKATAKAEVFGQNITNPASKPPSPFEHLYKSDVYNITPKINEVYQPTFPTNSSTTQTASTAASANTTDAFGFANVFPNKPNYQQMPPEFRYDQSTGAYAWNPMDAPINQFNLGGASQPTKMPSNNCTFFNRNNQNNGYDCYAPYYQDVTTNNAGFELFPAPNSNSASAGFEPFPASAVPENVETHTEASAPTAHILPEMLVTGAVNAASTAFNRARSVLNAIVTPNGEPGQWINGHWVSSSQETPREQNLRALAEMGFWDRDLNASLLARYKDDITRVVAELIQ